MSNPSTLADVKVAIVATNGFEQSELTSPKKALEEKGVAVEVLSIHGQDSIRGWDEKDWGESVVVDKQLSDADISDYAAIVLPGGQMNPDILRNESEVIEFIKRGHESQNIKAVAAICHGPWLLIEAELAKGKNIASFPSIKTDLKNAGANWRDESVVSDGKLITSRNPDDLPDFNQAILDKILH